MNRSQTYPFHAASSSLTRGSPCRDYSGGAHNYQRKRPCSYAGSTDVSNASLSNWMTKGRLYQSILIVPRIGCIPMIVFGILYQPEYWLLLTTQARRIKNKADALGNIVGVGAVGFLKSLDVEGPSFSNVIDEKSNQNILRVTPDLKFPNFLERQIKGLLSFHIAISSKRLSGVVKRRRLLPGGGAPIMRGLVASRNMQEAQP